MAAKKFKGTPLDKQGHYRALKIAPGSGIDDIRLAYAMAKQTASGPYLEKLTKAYNVLKDSKRREAYDAEGQSSGIEVMKSPITLVVALVILIVTVTILWLPEIQLRGKKFQSGQTLVEISSGREFGTIVQIDSSHQFGSGQPTTGYLVQLAGNGSERWFPAIDLQATCNSR
jgi:curved DNA-binding protein CbpA